MDTEAELVEAEEEVVVEEGTRPKRVWTEKQQAALAAAREKAWAKRKELGDISSKEKELAKKMKLLALRKRKKKVEQRLAKLEAGEDSSCTSSSEEDEPPPLPPPKHKTRSKSGGNRPPREDNSMGHAGYDVDYHERPVAVPAGGAFPARGAVPPTPDMTDLTREMLKAKIMRESQAQAFASLFPGKHNPFS